jgi:hypothetical protein
MTNDNVTKFLDKYFEERPQLEKPKKGILGYDVQSVLNPVLEFLINKHNSSENENDSQINILDSLLEENSNSIDNEQISWKKGEESNYIPILPDGYRYCSNCDRFTPYYEDDTGYMKKSVCRVCEHETYTEYMCECGHDFDIEGFYDSYPETEIIHGAGCHNFPEVHEDYYNDDDKVFREYKTVMSNQYGYQHLRIYARSYADVILGEFLESLSNWDILKLEKQLHNILGTGIGFNERNHGCNCEEVKVFKVDHCVQYNSRYVYSMDCMNAMEWDFTLKCPICGRLMEHWDGNC